MNRKLDENDDWAIEIVGCCSGQRDIAHRISRADEFGSKGAGWYVRPPVADAAPIGPFTSQLECIVVAKATTNANGIHDGTPYSCTFLTAQVVADLTGKTK